MLRFLSYIIGVIVLAISMPFIVLGFTFGMIYDAVEAGWEIWETFDETISRGMEG